MVDVYTIGFFLVLTLVFLYWGIVKRSLFAGFGCAFVLVIFGVLFLSTGVGFPASDNSTVLYNYQNTTINGSVFNSTGDFRGFVTFNNSLLDTKTLETTYNYNTTRDVFTDGLGLLIIFAGLLYGYETLFEYLGRRRLNAFNQEQLKKEEAEEI